MSKKQNTMSSPLIEESVKLKEVDIWRCIDSYFEENPYCLIQHHIDSYNDFYENGIFRIFRENNRIELRIQKYADREDDYSFKCILYFGGKLEPTDETNAKGDVLRPRIHFGKPVIYDKTGGAGGAGGAGVGGGAVSSHLMFPNEARLRNMNYSMSIHYDLDVEYLEYNTARGEYKTVGSIVSYNNIFLGKFPIMVQSKFCVLWNLPRDARFTMGECRNDLGGYFIVEGKEKTVVPLESPADNTVYVERGKPEKGDKHLVQIKFKSVSEDTSKPVRNLYIQLIGETVSEKTGIIQENGHILVEIPNVRKPIPLMILFRALGIITDKEIIQVCLHDMTKYADMVPHFLPSIYDAGNITTQKLALQYIAQFCKMKNTTFVMSVLCDNLFPHIGEKNFIEKAYYLGYLIFRLMAVRIGIEEPTNRDDLKNKRIELIGPLLYNLFCDYYKIQVKAIRVEFEKKLGIFTNEKKYETVEEIQKVINDNYVDILKNTNLKDANINDGFKRAFKGNWGAHPHTKKVGIIQDLNRLSFNSILAHLRKITLPMDDTLKLADPRKLHSSHWGFFDPIDTPDGGNIGVHKTMAIATIISKGFSREPIIEWLRVFASLKGVVECGFAELTVMTKFFVNGHWCGMLSEPMATIRKFKLYRRNGLIPPLASISFDYNLNAIYVHTDSGRMCRPIFYRDDYTGGLFYDDTVAMTVHFAKGVSWSRLIGGSPNGYNAVVVRAFDGTVEEERRANSDLEGTYHRKKGIVDYIDPSETENTLIAVDSKSLMPMHTHLEIHPSLILGLMSNLIVFPENNPPNRNTFSCGQSKQAVSLYSTQFQNRMDKTALILNYGQMPLLKTRYLDYICHEENPYGVNAIVAIMANSGYNMEDSIIINEGALKRGLFQTTYLTTYETHEEKSGIGGAKSNVYINPTIRGQKRDYDYSVLDDYGIIPENTVVHDKMVLIGISSSDPLNPRLEPKDISVIPKKGQMGSVNKTFITDSEEGERIAKVRISDIRVPTFGDKFASRLGQKGVIGMVMREEDMPFTVSGIRPDMIINPHAIPTRMTIGQLVECIIGKSASILGSYGDCTAFSEDGAKFEEFGRALTEIGGYHSSGNEIMMNGRTGEQIESEIFIGPTYYMRLKHMVKDKINYRERGPMNSLTRQPVGGRANDGGLRIGEMERDVLVSHGITNFLEESMMERGDAYKMAVCNITGTPMALNQRKNVCVSPMADGPLEFTPTEDLQGVVLKKTAKQYSNDFSVVSIPYTLKLLMQELGTINVGMRIITEKTVPFMDSLSYSDNIYKLKGIDPTDGSKTVKALLKNRQDNTPSVKPVRPSLKGGDNEPPEFPDDNFDRDGIGGVDGGGDITLEDQTKLNTLMNQIDETGIPPDELYEEPYASDDDNDGDNMDKWYGTDDDSDEGLERLEILDDIVEPLEVMNIADLPTTFLQQSQQPNITVSPIINIGDNGGIKLGQEYDDTHNNSGYAIGHNNNNSGNTSHPEENIIDIMNSKSGGGIVVDKTE